MKEESISILTVKDLNVFVKHSNKQILKRVGFEIKESEFFVVLGKNGQGKSTLSLSITNLLNKNIFKVSGEILFNGIDLLSLSEDEIIKIRQSRIGYILQNPFSSFDPIKTIQSQFEELSKLKNISLQNFYDLMIALNLSNIEEIIKKYPFELSGGILQRLSVVRCLASNPDLIIADEPTSALDKPVANQLLNLFEYYVKNKKKALILITQDISIAEKYADKIAFLHQGEIKSILNRENLFDEIADLELKIILESYEQLKYGK